MALEHEITGLLLQLRTGDRDALDRVFALVYEELRARARRQLRLDAAAQTLSPTALVHELYVKLVQATPLQLEDRRHFFALTARAMRQIVIDHARRALAQKRGAGAHQVSVELADVSPATAPTDLLALDHALNELTELDERLARMVELRFFAGLSVDETADAMAVSPRTVKRDWRKARAFLLRVLAVDGASA